MILCVINSGLLQLHWSAMSRGGKSKNAYLPGDLVALGSKNSNRVEPNPQEKRGNNILLHRKLMESTLTGKFLNIINGVVILTYVS